MTWQLAGIWVSGALVGWASRGIYERWQARRRMIAALRFIHATIAHMNEQNERPANSRDINELRRMMGEEEK